MNNTVKRTISGVCFVAIVLGGLLFSKYVFLAIALAAELVMMTEFCEMTLSGDHRPQKAVTLASGAFLLLLFFAVRAFSLPMGWLSTGILAPMAVMVSMLLTRSKENFPLTAYLLTALVYIALPVSLSTLVVMDGEGGFNGMLMVCFFIIVWSSDIGAYCFGMTLGRNGRKLCPTISPGKSWAGFWGGLACTVAAAAILSAVGAFDVPMLPALGLGVLMHLAGVAGDLFESMWKRSYSLKDSGNIIPGHGGMLDRLDSSLFAMPVGALYLILLNLITI